MLFNMALISCLVRCRLIFWTEFQTPWHHNKKAFEKGTIDSGAKIMRTAIRLYSGNNLQNFGIPHKRNRNVMIQKMISLDYDFSVINRICSWGYGKNLNSSAYHRRFPAITGIDRIVPNNHFSHKTGFIPVTRIAGNIHSGIRDINQIVFSAVP